MTWILAGWVFYKQGYRETNTQSLVEAEKQSTLPHSWQVMQKKGEISESWASPLRSKMFIYHVEQPAVKSGTGKMTFLAWFEKQ